MRKSAILAAVCAMLVAATAFAIPNGETVVTASGTVTLTPAASAGPVMVEALANGTATIVIVSTSRSRTWPDTTLGDSDAAFALRENVPRPFVTQGEKVDQVIVTLGTATEVVITWTLAN